jgi:uncharacterized protein YjiK
MIILALLFTCAVTLSAATHADPTDVLFPYEWVGDIDQVEFNEPSGIVYHEKRETLFVVGDAGDLCEIKTDGALVQQKHLRDADLEGVTYDPSTGLLYLAVEGEERVLEVDPDSFDILREFTIPREVEGKMLLKEGGSGIESITFVPNLKKAHGGTFFVANQSWDLAAVEDGSALFEIELPLRSKTETVARHIRHIDPGIPDMSGLNYSDLSNSLLVLSDGSNSFFEISLLGEVKDGKAFPGENQEGIAFDGKGNIYIAQGSGGILKMRWLFE